MERYEHKVVLITGAGDIAGATARRLLSEGGKVALTDFSREALDQEARMLKEEGWDEDRVMTIPGDVRNLEDCQAAAAEVKEKWGRIDVLVATAGILRHFPIDELTEAQWQDVIDINLTGVYHSVKAVVPAMKEQNYGRIVLISSIGGCTGRPGVGVNYAAAKAGINGMAMCLGYELGPWNITVNSVAPGPLKGKMFLSLSQDKVDKLSAGVRIPRLGELDDIAGAIAYLGSDDASWTTGEVLDVNGGLQY